MRPSLHGITCQVSGPKLALPLTARPQMIVQYAAGWVATLAIFLMNLVSWQSLQEAEESYSGDDGAAVRLLPAVIHQHNDTHVLMLTSLHLLPAVICVLQHDDTHMLMLVSLQTRAKCWLFLSYIIAFAAVAGSAAVLVQCAQASLHLWLGVVCPWLFPRACWHDCFRLLCVLAVCACVRNLAHAGMTAFACCACSTLTPRACWHDCPLTLAVLVSETLRMLA